MGTVHHIGRAGCPACRGRGVIHTIDHGGERVSERCDCTRTSTERAQRQDSLEGVLAAALGGGR